MRAWSGGGGARTRAARERRISSSILRDLRSALTAFFSQREEKAAPPAGSGTRWLPPDSPHAFL